MIEPLHFTHVDVFSTRPYSGNSLPVFADAARLDAMQMLKLTQELRHFEAIFLSPTNEPHRFKARIFDLFEELPFAGHPIIGAAATLHEATVAADFCSWIFDLRDKSVMVQTERTPHGYFGLLDQGAPDFLSEVGDRVRFAQLFGLLEADLNPELPLAVVSTGLRYLIIPVSTQALANARIKHDLSEALRSVGAHFAVLLDEANVEIRHWNNDGIIEDVATGSAAGTIGAYRLRYGLVQADQTFTLQQGRFTGRPSQLRVQPEGTVNAITSVKVGGDVALVGHGTLAVRP
jgi:trans-2,3-dihydro-3-hydroxyanthranilate isomerase